LQPVGLSKKLDSIANPPLPAAALRKQNSDLTKANRAILEKLTRGLAIREDSTFAPLVRPSDSNEPIQSWFHYREGYTVALCRELFAAEESFVIDPFCGFGTTLIAAQRAGIRSAGLDVSPGSSIANP
jgi:DNA modification methylase